MRWKSFVSGDPFCDRLGRGLAVVCEAGAENPFGDLPELNAVDQADQNWSNEQRFPRAVAAGVRHVTVVQLKSTVAEMSVGRIVQETEGLVTYTVETPASGCASSDRLDSAMCGKQRLCEQ